MSKTVVGLMDNIDEAQAVVRDLVSAGIRREDIGFMGNEKQAIPSSAALNESEGEAGGAARGGILVTVACGSEAQASQAADIMKRHGGLERRVNSTPWLGAERRKAA